MHLITKQWFISYLHSRVGLRNPWHDYREMCIKRGSQVWGGVKFFWAVTVSILINRKDAVTLLGNLSSIYWNASVLRVVTAFLFMGLRKNDQKIAKNDLVWRMHEDMGVVCGAMFGEERVNNSVDLLSRVLFVFSVGQISALVTVTHFCSNLLLQMLECYWTCSHARLACFLFETNQHFVGSARIAGLCFFYTVHTNPLLDQRIRFFSQDNPLPFGLGTRISMLYRSLNTPFLELLRCQTVFSAFFSTSDRIAGL